MVSFLALLSAGGTKEEQATPGAISGPCVWLAQDPQGGAGSLILVRARPVLISWRADKDTLWLTPDDFVPWKHRRLVARTHNSTPSVPWLEIGL